MLDFLTHPEFLVAAAALMSVPIIIHLINRIRFKRIRWAAMEFLLKAQKRSRRRLIIQQLLLLLMRCLLVALVGLLVMRFTGFSLAQFGTKQSLHVVVLDDTLSTTDQWKENDGIKDSFQVARKELLIDKIAKGVAQSNPADKLMVLPLSKIHDKDHQFPTFTKLNDGAKFAELVAHVESLQPSKMHVPIVDGVRVAKNIAFNDPTSSTTIHLLSDFRQKDWDQAEGEALKKEILDVAGKKVKFRLVDTSHPLRTTGQGGIPLSHDNVGIVDLRPSTRIAGKDMPVSFTISVANYSAREADVNIVIFDDATGTERFDVDFNPPMPMKIPPGDIKQASFDLRFTPLIKAGESHFAQISARLESAQRSKLENDGIEADNLRHAAVEIREKVPVLVIDGEGKAGRTEGKDSFFIRTAMLSVPGGTYEVINGDELGGGVAVKALERADLHQYPSIFLLNVRELTPKQLTNLETYVREGGGLTVFLGPQVSPSWYNKNLFKEGQGLFPTPLKEPYLTLYKEDPIAEGVAIPRVELRENLFPNPANYPIFGPIFDQKDVLRDLPIRSYFQAPRGSWQEKAIELATLSNEQPPSYANTVKLIEPMVAALEKADEFKKYAKALDRHLRGMKKITDPNSGLKSHHLAAAIENLLKDKGNEKNVEEFPNMTELWATTGDPRVRSLKESLEIQRDDLRYGDPLVVAKNYGKGKVVAVMTTAGKDWNEWGGGSAATVLYEPFIWEMQNYLSSQSSESNLTVGKPVEIVVDPEPFKQSGRRLKMKRVFYKTAPGKLADEIVIAEQFGSEADQLLIFRFDDNNEPGTYVSTLSYEDGGKSLGSYAQVFNVDTPREGTLGRVAYETIKGDLIDKADLGQITFEGPGIQADDLVSRRSDFSESPWIFLLFLALLVAEQALAVHLSYHLRGSENEALMQSKPRASAAA